MGMDENVEKLIKAARNAREKKPVTDVTVEGQVSELVEAANEKLQRATKNSVRDALRTYDEVLASGAQGEYLVPLLVNRSHRAWTRWGSARPRPNLCDWPWTPCRLIVKRGKSYKGCGTSSSRGP